MKFTKETSRLFVPDGVPTSEALARTTHLAIGAHPDDLEIMAIDGILGCFRQPDRWFAGVVVTDGRGSAREGVYAGCTDDEMRLVRAGEQADPGAAVERSQSHGSRLAGYSLCEMPDPLQMRPGRSGGSE